MPTISAVTINPGYEASDQPPQTRCTSHATRQTRVRLRNPIFDYDATSGTRINYDPCAQRIHSSDTLYANFGFAVLHRHRSSKPNSTVHDTYPCAFGRWMSRDPIGEKGGSNLYIYLLNNGVIRFDLYGLLTVDNDPVKANPATLDIIGVLRQNVAGILGVVTVNDATHEPPGNSALMRILPGVLKIPSNAVTNGGPLPGTIRVDKYYAVKDTYEPSADSNFPTPGAYLDFTLNLGKNGNENAAGYKYYLYQIYKDNGTEWTLDVTKSSSNGDYSSFSPNSSGGVFHDRSTRSANKNITWAAKAIMVSVCLDAQGRPKSAKVYDGLSWGWKFTRSNL